MFLPLMHDSEHSGQTKSKTDFSAALLHYFYIIIDKYILVPAYQGPRVHAKCGYHAEQYMFKTRTFDNLP